MADDDEDLELQADWLAHDMWAFGATGNHKGKCIYRDPENPRDADYSCECPKCSDELGQAARDLVTEGWRKPE